MGKERVTEKQKKLFEFLQEKEQGNQSFTLDRLAEKTGYPLKGSVKAKMSRGEWDTIIFPTPAEGEFIAINTIGHSDEELAARISSKNRRSLEHDTSPLAGNPIAAELARLSRNEFVLALEMFNRPTSPNRIEAFLTHFIAGVEKLMKAKMVFQQGENSIWKRGKERRTKTLREVLKELFPSEANLVRLNLEAIISLRDQSTHYLLEEELTSIASRYFQSGVLNYCREYEQLVGKPPISMGGIGLLSLVVDEEATPFFILQKKYGTVKAHAIIKKIQDLEVKSDELNSSEFAIPLNATIGVVSKTSEASFTFANLASGKVVFVDRPLDPKQTHPHTTSELIELVNRRLSLEYTPEQLAAQLQRQDGRINKHDFESICANERWKEENGKTYHFNHGKQAQHTYSDAVIDFIIDKIKHKPDYLPRVKAKKVNQRVRVRQ